MDFKKQQDNFKKSFNNKWKEITMKLKIDILPQDLFSFDKMISATAIKIIYAAGLICCVLFGIGFLFNGTFTSFLIGLGILLVGPVVWRIICESAILLFGIYERLGNIRNILQKMEEPSLKEAIKAETTKDKEAVKSVKKNASRKKK